ncbi:dolichol-P-glucose synthetase [Rubrivivax gelatinosus]|uniref:glycosyltransferase family 2 protein n=1 Tax=Rubrivivax gelatinosus TaxID=28068 RepID=UPI001908B0A2|nr:glycosyltransferase family 2 protein [Rubrivivax gelatinosus]MBK1614428.1 dolichol-P-glucose synthetase [Rubrivivax gelatinosus]
MNRSAVLDNHNEVLPLAGAVAVEPPSTLELTILMPCLNEARTLGRCVAKARAFLAASGVEGEVLVADNGSIDGSQALAVELGARVVPVPERGYGAALRAGIAAARGRFVVMGDSDDSYDFSALAPFVEQLRAGHDLVVGNRFRGGIADGAMPPLHRYLGNPVLSFLGRRLFGGPLRDFHCGLRGFRRDAVLALHLVTPGMEFASEMIVKALQARLRVTEVPVTLSKDGRGRPPHLNTWRDGWRHLRYLMLYAPRWLFLYPGLAIFGFGLLQLALANAVRPGQIAWPVGIHTQLFAAAAMVLGYQTMLFAVGAVLARHFARLDTPHPRERWALQMAAGPTLPLWGGASALAGMALCAALMLQWGRAGFGALDPEVAMRQIIPGVALVLIGSQSLVASIFFAALRSAFDSSRPAATAAQRSR